MVLLRDSPGRTGTSQRGHQHRVQAQRLNQTSRNRLEPNHSFFVSSINTSLLLLSPPEREAMVFLTSMHHSQGSSLDKAG